VRYGDNTGQNSAKRASWGSRGQTGSRNMVAVCFTDSATPTSYLAKCRPKYTTTSGFANPLQVWPQRLFACIFRIAVNYTTFRTISGTFESISGFWVVLLGHRFRFGAPGFLIESISSRLCAIHKNSVSGALEAKLEVEICWRPVFPTQRPWLPIWLRILYGVYLAPLRLHRGRILTLAHCNGHGTWNIFA